MKQKPKITITNKQLTKMPSYMHTTLERIEKYNRQKNRLKMRRLEKVSNELLYVIEEKNDIIDEQAEEIERLKSIISSYEKKHITTPTIEKKTAINDTDGNSSNSTYGFLIMFFMLAVIKAVIM